jgi:hypothetical protein
MRYLFLIALIATLTGCSNWDWRETGRSLLESACNSFGNCGVSCTEGEPDGWCQ